MFPQADTAHVPILGIECIRIGRYDGDMWGAVCLRSFKQRVRIIIKLDSDRMCVHFLSFNRSFPFSQLTRISCTAALRRRQD